MIDRLLLSLAVATANVDRLSRSVQPKVWIDVIVFRPDGYRAVRLIGAKPEESRDFRAEVR